MVKRSGAFHGFNQAHVAPTPLDRAYYRGFLPRALRGAAKLALECLAGGREQQLLRPMAVKVIPGVGPATAQASQANQPFILKPSRSKTAACLPTIAVFPRLSYRNGGSGLPDRM